MNVRKRKVYAAKCAIIWPALTNADASPDTALLLMDATVRQ